MQHKYSSPPSSENGTETEKLHFKERLQLSKQLQDDLRHLTALIQFIKKQNKILLRAKEEVVQRWSPCKKWAMKLTVDQIYNLIISEQREARAAPAQTGI